MDGNRYFWEYPGEKKAYRVNGDNSFNRNKKAGFDQKAFTEYFNYLVKVNKDIIGKEVDIIDSSDSSLNCFPKMTIEKVLKKYG
jgi:hypothetical protein